MLTKEECLKELENSRFLTVSVINQDGQTEYSSDFEQTAVFNTFKQLIEEYFNPQPYKFEELHEDMWVWDDRLKACFLIKAIKPKTNWNIVIYANYLTDTFEELEFEENRFFPLIKAMEYQGKAGDEK